MKQKQCWICKKSFGNGVPIFYVNCCSYYICFDPCYKQEMNRSLVDNRKECKKCGQLHGALLWDDAHACYKPFHEEGARIFSCHEMFFCETGCRSYLGQMAHDTWFHLTSDASQQSITAPNTCPNARKVMKQNTNDYEVHIYDTAFQLHQDEEEVQWEGGQFRVTGLLQICQCVCSCEGECNYGVAH